jgi:hypothetical protein
VTRSWVTRSWVLQRVLATAATVAMALWVGGRRADRSDGRPESPVAADPRLPGPPGRTAGYVSDVNARPVAGAGSD